MLFITAACICDAGEHRSGNEDNFFFDGVHLPEQNRGLPAPRVLRAPARGLLLAVFDGMGGASFGEKAAYLAAETVRRGAGRAGTPEALVALLLEANGEILRAAAELPVGDMGSTAAAVSLHGRALALASLGDSRVYLLRRRGLRQLTRDHTDAALLRELGVRNRRPSLTQYLGMPEEIRPEPHTARLRLRRGDRILLCTDGLNERLGDRAIRAILENYAAPEEALRRLAAVARASGARDNITAILLRVEGSNYPFRRGQHEY